MEHKNNLTGWLITNRLQLKQGIIFSLLISLAVIVKGQSSTLYTFLYYGDTANVKINKEVVYDSKNKRGVAKKSKGDTTCYRVGNSEIIIIDNKKYKYISINTDTISEETTDTIVYELSEDDSETLEEINEQLNELSEKMDFEFDFDFKFPDIDIEVLDLPKPPATPKVKKYKYYYNDESKEEDDDESNIDTSKQDTTVIELKKRRYMIFGDPRARHIIIQKKYKLGNWDNEKIVITDNDEWEYDDSNDNYKTNYFLLDLGINSYLHNNKLSLPAGYDFLELDLVKSVGVDFWFFENELNLIRNRLKLKHGLGLNYNNYRFSENYHLIPDTSLVVGMPENTIFFKKNKLTTKFITMPVLLELETRENAKGHAFRIAAGGNLGYLLKAYTKQVYDVNGDKRKDKVYDKFNIEKLRYGLSGQIGYGNVNFFVNYTLSDLFEKGSGPELHPLTVGVRLIGL